MAGPPTCDYLNEVVGSVNPCTGRVEWSIFWYRLSTPVCATLFALFTVSTLLHIFQAINSRYFFLLYTLGIAGAVEALGWAFRCWAAAGLRWHAEGGGQWVYPMTAFLGQISTLALAPAFSMAGLYLTLGVLMKRLGQRYSRLSVKTYGTVFVTGDIISLCVQGAGGGIASSGETNEEADKGAKVIVGGVIIQMVIMTAYSMILLDFVYHFLRDQPVRQIHPFAFLDEMRCGRSRRSSTTASLETVTEPAQLTGEGQKKAKILLFACGLATTFIFIRSIFRTVELLDGWTGKLATDQVLFTVLDGGMILASSILLNILHPGYFLPRESKSHDLESKGFKKVDSPAGTPPATTDVERKL